MFPHKIWVALHYSILSTYTCTYTLHAGNIHYTEWNVGSQFTLRCNQINSHTNYNNGVSVDCHNPAGTLHAFNCNGVGKLLRATNIIFTAMYAWAGIGIRPLYISAPHNFTYLQIRLMSPHCNAVIRKFHFPFVYTGSFLLTLSLASSAKEFNLAKGYPLSC